MNQDIGERKRIALVADCGRLEYPGSLQPVVGRLHDLVVVDDRAVRAIQT